LSEGKTSLSLLLMASRSVLIDFLILSSHVRIIKNREGASEKESMIITFIVDSCFATVEDNAKNLRLS
jgi:hypothetical protein